MLGDKYFSRMYHHEFLALYAQRICDPIPMIFETEKPGVCSCSRSAKWVWDRPGGGCNRPLLGGCHRPLLGCLHTSLLRTTIGLPLKPPVVDIKEWSMAAVTRTLPCRFGWARTGTHTGHFNFKNPWYGITYHDPQYGIQNALLLCLLIFLCVISCHTANSQSNHPKLLRTRADRCSLEVSGLRPLPQRTWMRLGHIPLLLAVGQGQVIWCELLIYCLRCVRSAI